MFALPKAVTAHERRSFLPRLSACHVVHREPDKIERRRARSNHSSRNSQKEASAAALLAVATTSQPGTTIARCNLQISRSIRRTRFRTTAPPSRREVMSPNLAISPADPGAAVNRNRRPCAERPSARTYANSRPRRTRARRGNRNLSGFGMPGVGDFDTLGQQAFAAALAAAAENCTPALGLHSGAKAELSLSRALAWLIGAFHKSERMGYARYAMPLSRQCAKMLPGEPGYRPWFPRQVTAPTMELSGVSVLLSEGIGYRRAYFRSTSTL
jgi:hypothetical protein